MTVMTFFFRKMILSKSCKGTESSSFIGFLKKKLFRIKERRRPKSPPPPSYSLSAWYRFKGLLLKQIKHTFLEGGNLVPNRQIENNLHKIEIIMSSLDYNYENSE